MKTQVRNNIRSLLFLITLSFTTVYAQQQVDDVEVPGDNFSLEGALELFKKSASPEEFEKLLNSPESKVNNLDLNGDGDIDYIRVIDRNEKNVHAFIIQAVISSTENQDVAVIELEKMADGKASLQIIGDADIYGTETIIEPTQEVRVNAGTSTARTVVNVWAWPSVQYVYSPYYTGWVSPWGWFSWPMWWSTWRPVAYSVYNPWWTPYRVHYSYCYSPRIVYAHRMYRPMRTTSIVVYNRHHTQVTNYRSSNRHRDSNRYNRYDDRSDSRSYSHSKNENSDDRSRNRSYSRTGNERSNDNIFRNNTDRGTNRDSWSGEQRRSSMMDDVRRERSPRSSTSSTEQHQFNRRQERQPNFQQPQRNSKDDQRSPSMNSHEMRRTSPQVGRSNEGNSAIRQRQSGGEQQSSPGRRGRN